MCAARANARAIRDRYERRKLAASGKPAFTHDATAKRRQSRAAAANANASGGTAGGDRANWSALWTERPATTFARAERFAGDRNTRAQKTPSMRSYLQYLKLSQAEREGGGGGDQYTCSSAGSGSAQLPSAPEMTDAVPGPGSYNPVLQTRGEMPAITFSRVFPRFPEPISAAKKDCVKLKFPSAQEHASRELVRGRCGKIDPNTQRTDFTKLRESLSDNILDPDAGTKQSLATSCKLTAMRYSSCFKSGAPRMARAHIHSTSDALGPGVYDAVPGMVRSDRFQALESLGIKEPRKLNRSFKDARARQPLSDPTGAANLGPGVYNRVPGMFRSDNFKAMESLGVKDPARVSRSFLVPPRQPLTAGGFR